MTIFYLNFFSFIFTYLTINYLLSFKKWPINSIPKKNNSIVSNKPTPTSFGIIVILISLFFLYLKINFIDVNLNNFGVGIILSFFFFTIIGFIEDLFSINTILKILIISVIIISINLTYINIIELTLTNKFLFLFSFLTLFIYINSINFIDGSNGFFSTYCFFFIISVYLIQEYVFYSDLIFFELLFISWPPLLAFFLFNIRSKIFIGNVGSFFYGYLLTLIISYYLKQENLYIYCLILTMYPLLDVTLSLAIKVFNNRNLFKKDFCYFFLQPIIKTKKKTLFCFKKICFF